MRKIVMKKTLLALTLTLFTAAAAQAHSLWINAFESHAHTPPHIIDLYGGGARRNG